MKIHSNIFAFILNHLLIVLKMGKHVPVLLHVQTDTCVETHESGEWPQLSCFVCLCSLGIRFQNGAAPCASRKSREAGDSYITPCNTKA